MVCEGIRLSLRFRYGLQVPIRYASIASGSLACAQACAELHKRAPFHKAWSNYLKSCFIITKRLPDLAVVCDSLSGFLSYTPYTDHQFFAHLLRTLSGSSQRGLLHTELCGSSVSKRSSSSSCPSGLRPMPKLAAHPQKQECATCPAVHTYSLHEAFCRT